MRLNPTIIGSLGALTISNGEEIYLKQEAKRSLMFSDLREQREFWSGLRAIYSNARSILSFTRVGFNGPGDQAIVSVRAESEEGGTVETVILKKVDGNWRVARRHLEDEALTGAFVDGRCVAEQVGTPPTISQLAAIAGDYDFTLVSSAVDDRIFQWRMRFVRDTARKAGMIPAFQVLDPKTGARLIKREPGTYLNSGDVYFQNDSRMGSSMDLGSFWKSAESRQIDFLASGLTTLPGFQSGETEERVRNRQGIFARFVYRLDKEPNAVSSNFVSAVVAVQSSFVVVSDRMELR